MSMRDIERSLKGCHQRGMVLVTVLWVTALMAIMVSSLSGAVRGETNRVFHLLKAEQARHAAEGGIHLAAYHLLQTTPGKRWPTDGSVEERVINDILVRVAIYDEAGKIDINAVQATLLSNLLEVAGVDIERRDSLVDAILDWRDADQFRRLNGAEDEDYKLAGLNYEAKDGRYESVDELRLVLGMDSKTFQRIKPAVTVYSKRSGVNASMASRDVLLAVTGNDVSSVDTYLRQRQINHSAGLAPPPAPMQAKQYLSAAGGSVYTVNTEARMEDNIYSRLSATIVTRRGFPETPINIVAWRNDGISLFPRSIEKDQQQGGT